MIKQLPDGFEELETFAPAWCDLEAQEARYLARQGMGTTQLRAFYDAMVPRLDDMLEHLDRFPIDVPLPDSEDRLFRLALGLTEAAAALEVFGQPCVPGAPEHHRVANEIIDGTR